MAKVLSLHDSWTLRCDEMLKCAQTTGEKLYYKLKAAGLAPANA